MGRVQKSIKIILIDNKTILAIVPARGGSKRLPKKNILEFIDKPLIAWTINSSLKSRYIDKTIVSSDDIQILTLSKKYGAETVRRPKKYSTDTSNTFLAIKHAIVSLKTSYDIVILLQPTSPLRNQFHIDESIELLIKKKATSIISVCRSEHSPLWMNTLSKNNNMKDFIPKEIEQKRSQDLPSYYRLNGAIFISKIDAFLESKSFFHEKTFAYKMQSSVSFDIDNDDDFQMAAMYALHKNKI